MIKSQKALKKYVSSSQKSRCGSKKPKLPKSEQEPPATEEILVEEVIEEHLMDDDNFQDISYQIAEGEEVLDDVEPNNCEAIENDITIQEEVDDG